MSESEAKNITEKKHSYKNQGLIALSLISSPLIVFLITSLELYLNNRIDLDNKLIVLVPFLGIFVLMVVTGYFLLHFSNRNKIAKIFLIAYYLSGPFFLIYSSIRNIKTDNIWKLLFLVFLFSFILFFIYKKTEILKVAKAFAWLSAILIISELFLTYSNIAKIQSEKKSIYTENNQASQEYKKNLPNIYHVIFDEYQTDMFDLTLNDEIKRELGGFVYFPNNAAVYGRTGMSLATIFSGLSYDYKMPQIEYQKMAMNSEKSFLWALNQKGYENYAYIHKVYSFDLDNFDFVTEHKKNAVVELNDIIYVKAFVNLWLYSNLPVKISKKIIKPDAYSQIKDQNTLLNPYIFIIFNIPPSHNYMFLIYLF